MLSALTDRRKKEGSAMAGTPVSRRGTRFISGCRTGELSALSTVIGFSSAHAVHGSLTFRTIWPERISRASSRWFNAAWLMSPLGWQRRQPLRVESRRCARLTALRRHRPHRQGLTRARSRHEDPRHQDPGQPLICLPRQRAVVTLSAKVSTSRPPSIARIRPDGTLEQAPR
jgi:hypothetical protein